MASESSATLVEVPRRSRRSVAVGQPLLDIAANRSMAPFPLSSWVIEPHQWRYGGVVSLLRLGLILASVSANIFGVMGIALLVEGDRATARTTFAVGVIVAATSGASVIYQVDRWTLSLQSTIHFTIMIATVLPALFLGGWFTLDSPVDYLAVIGIFLVTGLALWVVMFLVFGVVLPKRRTSRERSPANST